jgi:hypothetical protein
MDNFKNVDGLMIDQRMRFSKRVRPVKEYVDDGPLEIIAEQGYMPTKMQIERFMQAGIVLQDFKRHLFDEVNSEEV